MGWPCVDVHLPYLTCYLQMTLYCFVGLLKGRCRLSLNCCRHMQMPQDNALILISHLSISLQTQPQTKGRELRWSQVFMRWTGLNPIQGYPHWLAEPNIKLSSLPKNRVWKKIQGWKGQMLSRAKKEVLIKAVAQSISTYTMGVFLLPMRLCNDLNAMCARFW